MHLVFYKRTKIHIRKQNSLEMPIVQVHLLEGRAKALKQLLVSEITAKIDMIINYIFFCVYLELIIINTEIYKKKKNHIRGENNNEI
jgi:hypothetical protein